MLEHGGRLRKAAEQYGIAEADWLDLSSGLAPWPWPIPEIGIRAWARLPETDDGLEQAARDYYGAAHVLPVPGSQAAIQLLPRLRRAGKVGVLSPCYAEHAEAWRRSGYIVREVLEQEVDFFLDSLDVLVVVNPNNPTGLSLTPERLLDWHARLAQRGGWLVVDEAFMDNTPQLSLAAQADQVGLIVLRSFGKFFGLAGVRLGFVLAERKLLKLLAEQVGPWAVSGPTRVLGQVCLRDSQGHARQRLRSEVASLRLAHLLERHGLKPQGGCALFQWLITDRAELLHEFMARRGILLRLFTHNSSLRFGLPADEADWSRLEQAFVAYAKEHP
ncbi:MULTISPECIES: threonine-phosphate decarboxylase CobD [Pseudomonas]|jgi:cobalamin biosynthetic protein CobC|uniref:threonine-phosphate decarboxylase n=3 Tax=Pseudomonas chlororaphis TaxID=587753 RepID=A0AAP9VTE3_9PSED|nr:MULTISPECIES: threonine-phosphate decarboxylase CobD [Pseudomonas]AIS11764.1 threonine-phosphate decarboxylase [Pseudomonas chlororaphis subsp. aurantiaca]AUG42454.1 threonine-phosphate decarboxylase [Pseudomonas chlororaphis]AZD23747.1 L-threonine 3-O-phosphate decarboxylase [Pseudomonas chlororaphis subsp. aurantiaca]AZD50007.1 L-threonine 3-O-phosphate decarboxylase [Pseudomonas chlororaphis subsp. aurantiaca]AZD56334.1 L-threonine 3-O-phosphate decarboxylase [Pseudomonas chlororaphis su